MPEWENKVEMYVTTSLLDNADLSIHSQKQDHLSLTLMRQQKTYLLQGTTVVKSSGERRIDGV